MDKFINSNLEISKSFSANSNKQSIENKQQESYKKTEMKFLHYSFH